MMDRGRARLERGIGRTPTHEGTVAGAATIGSIGVERNFLARPRASGYGPVDRTGPRAFFRRIAELGAHAMTDCLFCRIARGEIPSTKVAETDELLAFRDIAPQAPTHILIIPKEHVAGSAADVTAGQGPLLGELFPLAARIAREERLESGWRLVTNVGPHAGQTVFHLHFHLVGGAPMGRFGS